MDGVMMNLAHKSTGDPLDVHVQCYGTADGSIHIVNTQFAATLGNLNLQ
jgi:hypothetical protein